MGDIGSSQSLNRYAYCEGNPVSMVDPFGLCPQSQEEVSKYQFWHNVLDVVGLVCDAADVINAALYAYEKDWTNAAICAASAIPEVGAAVVGAAKSAKAIIKAKKAEKIASLAAEASRMTKKAADTLDTLSDTMRVAEKYGKDVIKSADNIISDVGAKAINAMETGGDIGKEASKAVKSAESAVSAGGLRLSTKADEGASLLKHGSAGADGIAKSASDTTNLYRVMSEEEFSSVMLNKKFVPYDRAMEEKWFATTQDNATKWANILYPDANYRMVEVTVDTNCLKDMYYNQYLDNIGPAYCSSLEVLEKAIKSIKGVK